jgi:Tfp pilus assembly protein PilF
MSSGLASAAVTDAESPMRIVAAGTTFVLLLVVALFVACGGGGQATKKPEEPTTQERVRSAQSLFRAGRVSEALAILEQTLRDEPDNARLHTAYGTMLFQAGQYDDAVGAFEQALVLDPHLTDAHNFLGVTFAELGREDEAEEQYRIALRDPAYPTPELVYLNLGLLRASQGRKREAVEQYRLAVEINPKFYRGHFELASILDELDELREAAQEYEVAEPEYKQNGEFHYRLGLVYFRLGDKARSRERLERAISVSPGSNSAARAADLLEMLD